MKKKMFIDSGQKDDIRIAITEGNNLVDYESEKIKNDRIKGNIFLAKIVRVEPSLQAAFVDYGGNKHGFLAYNEIHPDYFKIPTADKKKLLAQELEDSKNMVVENDDDDDDFLDENDENNEEQNEKNTKLVEKGFLTKVFDFFNYKPIDDYSTPRVRRKKNFRNSNKNRSIIYHRKYSIQEVIKSNQVILIQVVKEERGNKGAAVTTRLSLAGKYCVLMPNTNKGGGISRKIVDLKLRKKLKEVVSKLNIQKGMGVIVRTAGESMGVKEIKRDYNSLIKLWNEITTKTIKSNAPCLIHEEDNIIKRSLRDYFDNSFDEVLINDKKTFLKSKEIVKQFMPQSIKFLKNYKEKNSLFMDYGIEKKIIDIYNPIVHLKSGGYLGINQTEALVAIDINSGRFTKQRNIEDTAFKTNLEAAEEISRQIIIRDLAGLIVIDFIDMLDRPHNIKVERRLKDLAKNDRARVQIGRISNFGLLELSRQRLKVSSDTTSAVKCKHCNGYGSILSESFLLDQLIRVCLEFKYEKSKENIFVLTSEKLHSLILDKTREKSKLYTGLLKNINLARYPKLDDLEYLVCTKNEILMKNCHTGTDTDDYSDFLVFEKKPLENKEKTIKKNVKDHISSKKSDISPKRISYRAKAKEFNYGKNLEKNLKSKKRKIDIKDEQMKIFAKSKKSEKKQGWWSQ